MKRLRTILGFAMVLACFTAGPSFAATQSVTANIEFAAALSMTKSSDINFGKVLAGQVGKYTISTDGAVTAEDGGTWVGGQTEAASLTLAGSSLQAVDISVNGYVADNGVTPSAATCSYNGGPAAACALVDQPPPGDGKPLLLGVSVDVDGTQELGATAAPSFNVVVNYH